MIFRLAQHEIAGYPLLLVLFMYVIIRCSTAFPHNDSLGTDASQDARIKYLVPEAQNHPPPRIRKLATAKAL